MKNDLSENEQFDLVLVAIISELKAKNIPLKETSIQWHKLIFKVAEDCDLDITRSWYKFGDYIWDQQRIDMLRIRSMFQAPQFRRYYDLSKKTLSEIANSKGVFIKIEQSVKKNIFLYKKEAKELKAWVYDNMAPEWTRKVYKSNMAHSDFFLAVIENRGSKLKFEGNSNYYSELINKFHLDLIEMDLDPKIVDITIMYSSLMELLMIKYDSLEKKNYDLNNMWLRELKNALDIYNDEIWEFPGSQIAKQTMKGERDKEYIVGRERTIRSVDRYLVEKLQAKQNEWIEKGLLPTIEEIDLEISRMEEKNPDDANNVNDALKFYFHPRD